MTQIHGQVDEGFGAIADAFASNFELHGEVGAAFSLYLDGAQRVDIWAGVADKESGAPWNADTLQLVFSTTKGIASLCIAMLVDAGKLAYTDRVADHWPEFGAAGKGDITVEQLLSHQAGLIDLQPPLEFDEIMQVTPAVESLARQAPIWEPGTALGYHAITFGWLAGELIARVDGRRIGQFIDEEINAPLGTEFHIGLPESKEPRVSRLESTPPPTDPELLARYAEMYRRDAYGYRALSLNGTIRMAPVNHFNSRELHATEMPAANGITGARSLARIYAASIGEVDGVRLLSTEAMNAARTERVYADDLTLLNPSRFGAGFWLHEPGSPMIQDGSFGHSGAGGSLAFANPELGVGYGYVMNQMGGGVTSDPRRDALNAAVLSCVT